MGGVKQLDSRIYCYVKYLDGPNIGKCAKISSDKIRKFNKEAGFVPNQKYTVVFTPKNGEKKTYSCYILDSNGKHKFKLLGILNL